MSKTKKDGAWHRVKLFVYQLQNGRCSICGRTLPFRECIGHHKVNRCKGGKSTVDNAEIRCVDCERQAHKKYAYGNPPSLPVVGYHFRPLK